VSALDKAVTEAAEGLVRGIAGQLGVQLDAAQVVALGKEGLTHLAGLVSAANWKEAKAAGTAAAASINTLEEAEAAAKGRK
jgi:hypothetical protein